MKKNKNSITYLDENFTPEMALKEYVNTKKGVCKTYKKDANGYFTLPDVWDCINACQNLVIENRFGNQKKCEKLSSKQIEKTKASYFKYREKLLEIMKNNLMEDVPDYFYNEEMLIKYNFNLIDSPFNRWCDQENIALATAIFILEETKVANNYNKLLEIIEDYKATYDFMAKIKDPFFSTAVIEKVAQIVLEHNKENSNYNSINPFYVDGKANKTSKSYTIYQKLIDLIPKENIENTIDCFKDNGFSYFESILLDKNNLIERLIKIRKDYTKLFDEAKNIISKGKAFFLNPSFDPHKLPINVNAVAITVMLNNLTKLDNEEDVLCGFIYQTLSRHFELSYLNYGQLIAQESIKNMAQMNKSFFSDIDNLSDLKLEEPTMVHIQDPYALIAGYVLASDRQEDFLELYAIWGGVLNYCLNVLPWNLDNVDRKFFKEVCKENDCNVRAVIPENVCDYVYCPLPNENDDNLSTLNLAQIMYMNSGIIMPRFITSGTIAEDFIDNFDFGAYDSEQLAKLFIKILESTHCQELYYQEKTTNEIDEKLSKTYDKKLDEYKKETTNSLSKEISELKKQNYEVSKSLKKLTKENEELNKKYDSDMEELKQLREIMFNSQKEEAKDEEVNVKLPYKLKKNIVMFGGHDKFINRVKENVEGNIKFFQNKADFKKTTFGNVDLFVIQIKYIGHPLYYGAIEYAKTHNIPFICLNSASLSGFIKVLQENDA